MYVVRSALQPLRWQGLEFFEDRFEVHYFKLLSGIKPCKPKQAKELACSTLVVRLAPRSRLSALSTVQLFWSVRPPLIKKVNALDWPVKGFACPHRSRPVARNQTTRGSVYRR